MRALLYLAAFVLALWVAGCRDPRPYLGHDQRLEVDDDLDRVLVAVSRLAARRADRAGRRLAGVGPPAEGDPRGLLTSLADAIAARLAEVAGNARMEASVLEEQVELFQRERSEVEQGLGGAPAEELAESLVHGERTAMVASDRLRRLADIVDAYGEERHRGGPPRRRA